jgi:ADP-ribose pyrophosphatase YjhB (NUDIX family)
MGIIQSKIYQAIDELRAISSMGLYYSQDEYDRERYQRVLEVALRLFAEMEETPFDKIMRDFREENWLHASPAAGAEAVIMKDNKILLIKRRDNGLWAVPGGLVEVGETLAEAAIRELQEETGIKGKVAKLLGIFDSRLWQSNTQVHLNHFVFLAETANLNSKVGQEAIDVDFFDEQDLPELSPGHHLRVPILFRILRGEIPAPYFDREV